jgi:hypothetical protein
MKPMLTSFLVLASLTSYAGKDVIYGEDNRKDVFESTDSVLVELSKSTAAMIAPGNLRELSNGEVQVSSQTLEQRGVCS